MMEIVCFNTHVPYLFNLAHTNHTFYIPNAPSVWVSSAWKEFVRPVPKNINFLTDVQFSPNEIWKKEYLLQDKIYDVVLYFSLTCYNLLKHIKAKKQIFVSQMTFPTYENAVKTKFYTKETVDMYYDYFLKNLKDIPKIFVSDFKKNTYPKTDSIQKTIRHGVNTTIFDGYNGQINKFFASATIAETKLTVYHLHDIYNKIMENHDIYLVGTNGPRGSIDPNNTKDPFYIASFQHLVNLYRNNRAYVNIITRDISMALLEAMSTGMPVVSVEIKELKQFVTNEKDILMSDDTKLLGEYIDRLSKDLKFAKEIGYNGRELIKKYFSIERFTNEWNEFLVKI